MKKLTMNTAMNWLIINNSNSNLELKVQQLEHELSEADKRHRRLMEQITTSFVREKQETLTKFDNY